MIDLLLIWYAAIAIGFGASVYRTTREPETKPQHVRMLPPWLSNITAHAEALEGYQDPLFFADSDAKHAAKQKQH